MQVWDYSVFGETQIGGTLIDLEDRLFSPEWQQMQQAKTLPKETRTLTNPGTATPQGSIVLRVEILEHKAAIAQPMLELSPPVKEQFELRLIVWEARDVAITDEVTRGSPNPDPHPHPHPHRSPLTAHHSPLTSHPQPSTLTLTVTRRRSPW